MIINANEILVQTGLIPNNEETNRYKSNVQYQIHLEIQLSQYQKTLLKVTDQDNPYKIAEQFCHKHHLNRLASAIIEKKIKEAILLEKQKHINNPKNQKINQKQSVKNINKSASKSKYTRKIDDRETKNTNINKQYQIAKSPEKCTPANKNKVVHKFQNDNNENIYERAIKKAKLMQQIRNQLKDEKLKNQQKQLTFKPQINTVSEKIIQFLHTNNIQKQKRRSPPIAKQDQFNQCTFKPQINKESQKILSSKSLRKQQRQQYNLMYKQKSQDENISRKKKQVQQLTFTPQINTKSALKVTLPFFQRLEIDQKKRNKQTNKLHCCQEEEYSFHPKIGRAPFKDRNKDNMNIWEYLHYGTKKSQQNTDNIQTEPETTKAPKQLSITQQYYQNLVQQRIDQVFSILDSNNDGLISPTQISVQQLPKPCLKFLKPILRQMDEIDATLNFSQFRRAILKLLVHADQGSKGSFLSSGWKKQLEKEFGFKPSINRRSKNMLENRSMQNIYQDGLKFQKNKNEKLEKQRAVLAERQMEQCSFKPMLNHSSKTYVEKYAKKIQKNTNKSIDDLLKSYQQEESQKMEKEKNIKISQINQNDQ